VTNGFSRLITNHKWSCSSSSRATFAYGYWHSEDNQSEGMLCKIFDELFGVFCKIK